MGPGSRGASRSISGPWHFSPCHRPTFPWDSDHPCDHLFQQNTPALLAPLVEKAGNETQSLVSLLSLQGINPSLSVRLHPLPHLLLSANALRPACPSLLYTVGVPIDHFISYLCSYQTPGAVSFLLACVLRRAAGTISELRMGGGMFHSIHPRRMN